MVAAHPGMARVVFDVEDGAAMPGFVAGLIAAHPGLNVLINNAGVMRAEDLTADPVDLADAEATVVTNMLGPIRLTAALLPHLQRQSRAAVVNMTSGLAFVPLALTPTYSATKAALHSYSQSLRHQLRKTPVEVIEIAPPAVRTDLMASSRGNPNAMDLAPFIAEVMALLAAGGEEVLVDHVKRLRFAEQSGSLAGVFGMLNPA